jgi:hypothetical protein
MRIILWQSAVFSGKVYLLHRYTMKVIKPTW